MKEFKLTEEQKCNQIASLYIDLDNIQHHRLDNVNNAIENKIKEITGVQDVKINIITNKTHISDENYDIHLDYTDDSTNVTISIIKFESTLIWE